MTKDEALKLALEALETELAVDWTNNDEFNLSAEKMHEAITAIKEALAQPEQEHFALKHRIAELEGAVIGLQAQLAQTQEQEPAAWVWVNNKGWLTYSELPHDMWKSSPLYAHPPQRTWVGLTDDEIEQGLLRSDYAFKTAEAWRAGVVFAMTKLKEKNA